MKELGANTLSEKMVDFSLCFPDSDSSLFL